MTPKELLAVWDNEVFWFREWGVCYWNVLVENGLLPPDVVAYGK